MIKVPKKKSRPVLEFATIAKDARAMSRLIQKYVSPIGKGSNNHLAIHHSQYSSDPYNFFVINPHVVGAAPTDTVVVVNPVILEKVKGTKMIVHEGCMSFPFRPGTKVARYGTIKVMYQVPTPDGTSMTNKTEEMTGLMAQIFQHEVEHGHGTHIYAA